MQLIVVTGVARADGGSQWDMPETFHRIKRGTTSQHIAPAISPSPPCRIVFLSPTDIISLYSNCRLAVSHRILFLTFIASIYLMAEAHGDAGAEARDVVELQGTVTADEVKDVGGVHNGAGKLATAADVEKEVAVSASVLLEQKVTTSSRAVHPDTRDAQPSEEQEVFVERMMDGGKRKLAFTGFDPYDPGYSDVEEYEYDSREDVYKGNFKSFKAKEIEKIKAKGVVSFFNRKIKKWCCPYCTTKPKPKDGCFDHLVSHAEDVANRGEDYMIKGQHAALAKALTPA
ncbi:lrr receptor-like serine threonine-protein kinase [Hordeum vulgare]|nr:lrr receptor-like serine threonine-protein kinase [Hordeum vulgare]